MDLNCDLGHVFMIMVRPDIRRMKVQIIKNMHRAKSSDVSYRENIILILAYRPR
jgi:hypothetical protein